MTDSDLKSRQTTHDLRTNRIYAIALDVFGDEEKAAIWLKRPNRSLGNKSPVQLLGTDVGTQRLERELRRIQHGFAY